MRKINVFKYISRFDDETKRFVSERVLYFTGAFHGFNIGHELEEMHDGTRHFVNTTCAIVEKNDGTIELCPLRLIQFVTPLANYM